MLKPRLQNVVHTTRPSRLLGMNLPPVIRLTPSNEFGRLANAIFGRSNEFFIACPLLSYCLHAPAMLCGVRRDALLPAHSKFAGEKDQETFGPKGGFAAPSVNGPSW